ncbi:hypothetical protein TWF481_000483 [Arthrobotrys musiformis]|uniref:F-box domain-containing protein n=1 Tax=Arthrobotrys musiformis TaxID=47236 RepID=A0AAV9WMQ3_9PEZI
MPKPNPLTTLPAEIHLEILSHIPSLADQISASLSYPPWKHLLLTSQTFKELRYFFHRPWRLEGLHNLLSPTHYHTFFGFTAKSGVITSYSLYTFDRRHHDWHTELARVVRYRQRQPHRYGPGKRVFEDDDEDLGVDRRDYTDFSKLLKKLDLYTPQPHTNQEDSEDEDEEAGFINEQIITPFVPPEVKETDWKLPLNLTYHNENYQWAVLGKMFLQGFPISFRSGVMNDHTRQHKEFHTFYLPPAQSSSPSLSLKKISKIVLKELNTRFTNEPGKPYDLRRDVERVHPNHSKILMKSEGMDPEKEHIILLDQNWHRTTFHDGEMGVAVIILPFDDEEQRLLTQQMDLRKRMGVHRFAEAQSYTYVNTLM